MSEEAMNIAMEINHKVIPVPEPGIDSGKALSGGYMVHPAEAGPDSTNREESMIMLERKNSQYETMFKKGEAISRAPIWNGINKLLKVPLKPAVSTKNTMMVP